MNRLLIVIFCIVMLMAPLSVSADTAQEILDTSRIKGGLVVCVGCGDAEFVTELYAGKQYLVHALDTDQKNVDAVRKYIQSKGLYGEISIDTWDGKRLPYADNLVNLLIYEERAGVSVQVSGREIERILAPRGVVLIKGNLKPRNEDGAKAPETCNLKPQSPAGLKGWNIYKKKVPPEIDDWTHYLHGPDNNAVARDSVAGPPARIQWLAGPKWARHHDVVPSTSLFVSSGGRIFTAEDRAPIGIGSTGPDEWYLVARDAFNGMELWRISIPQTDWGWHSWGKSHVGGYSARYNHPKKSARLAAVGNRVYLTKGMLAPISAFDAATGKLLKEYAGTEWTDEFLVRDNLIIASVNTEKPDLILGKAGSHLNKSIVVLDAETGAIKWKEGPFQGLKMKADSSVGNLHISSNKSRVLLIDGDDIVALDIGTGKEVWRSKRYQPWLSMNNDPRRFQYKYIFSNMIRIVADDDVVLLAQQDTDKDRLKTVFPVPLKVRAFSSDKGNVLWEYEGRHASYYMSPEIFVIDDVVWVHDKKDYAMVCLDLKTGKELRRRDTKYALDNGHHHRCYVNRATEKYLTTNYRGMEFMPWDSDETSNNHWIRGACRVGTFLCNGLVYGSPHACDCYFTSKLSGYVALAAEREEGSVKREAKERLEKGSVYGQDPQSAIRNPQSAWPSYRHDAERSGYIDAEMPAQLKEKWQRKIADGAQLTPPVVADGKVFVAAKHKHSVYTLDSSTGKIVWQFTANGPIDSPPTVYNENLLFGSMSGWVYCLRVSDGELAWRFRAAPEDKLIMAPDGLESAWPVHGSVLAENGKVFFTAGRSSFLDGGIYAYRLDLQTGKLLEQKRIESKAGEKVSDGRGIISEDYGLLSDIFVKDKKSLFMRQREIFSLTEVNKSIPEPNPWPMALVSTGGILDDTWFNRGFWTLDGIGIGQMFVFNKNLICAVRAYEKAGTTDSFALARDGYTLFALDRTNLEIKDKRGFASRTRYPTETKWSVQVPVRTSSLVLTKDKLFAAGSPDKIDSENPWSYYRGERNGLLMVIASDSGKILNESQLESPPVFDGMAVAGKKLFISCKDGSLVCFGK
ncbi:PQQ-binding-like beta-propeller repeat protein [Verrucomicrobiota bacterium]